MAKKTKRNISINKHAVKVDGYSTDNKKVIWRFDMVDRSGKFAFDLMREDFRHKAFLEKMIGYSSMTWTDVKNQTHDDGKSKNHFLSVQSLSKEALERLKARSLEGYSDSIFSFALDNQLRLIGIRINEHFHVLWYDPRHEACPSTKKTYII